MITDEIRYRVLFENLLNRLIYDEESKSYSLPGVITEKEREALNFAADVLSSEKMAIGDHSRVENVSEGSETVELRADKASHSLEPDPPESDIEGIIESQGIETLLNVSVLHPRKKFSSQLKLGLDFGTAYSKACMIRSHEDSEEILELPLGIFAGEDVLQMPVHSSLFIDPDGRLYFGPIAVERSEQAMSSANAISRIDSIKAILIEDFTVDLDEDYLQPAFNPTEVEVCKAALLAFYLGYLLFLVRVAAKDKHDVDILEVQRRISLPCYEDSHRQKVSKILSRLFSMGEVLGASFTEEWESGFRIEDVMYLYRWMKEHVNKLSPYIEKFVDEPLAVAGGRLGIGGKSNGNVCMVVDVGAGTTDFSMFEIYANAETGYCRAREVKGSEYGIPVAGDKLDDILLKYILKSAELNRASDNYRETIISLRLDIRDYKERLFKRGELTYSLLGGKTGTILLSDFMKLPTVQKFGQELEAAFLHVLTSIRPSWIKSKILGQNADASLPVILTGGGANLPMVKSMGKGAVEINGLTVKRFLSPSVPGWLEESYTGEIIDLYPQLAVAIGGSKQFVIEKAGVQEEPVM